MNSSAARLASFLVLLGSASCGLVSVPSQASCDTRPKEQSCTDLLTNRNNQLESTLKALCVGTFSTGLCNHAGALGGCGCDGCENGKSVTWVFPDPSKNIQTAADAMRVCGSSPFIAP